ncbi:putative Phage-related protein, tail component [Candidatus Defluviicoccus seviourii]|uniref:Phage-related protein, tail component n=1 Tax=Candidatus Defluviicoccus seviourii TaxID=2565273 RepID=A0A564WH74_9PROT|nr:putative Phage-related protein, tail component [Candidatus Defluviicoccus seviourii]
MGELYYGGSKVGRITLMGELADHIPNGCVDLVYNSVAEAVAGLESITHGFYDLIRHRKLIVQVGEYELTSAQLQWRTTQPITIMPAPEGAANTTKIIVGALLVVAAIALVVVTAGAAAPGVGFAASMGGSALFGLTTVGGLALALGAAGAGMLVAGMAPTPEMSDLGADSLDGKRTSSVYQGPLNTQSAGGPVPVVYGRCLVGGVVIHADLQIQQLLDGS